MTDHEYFPEPNSGRCVANGDEPFCTLSPEQHQPPPTDAGRRGRRGVSMRCMGIITMPARRRRKGVTADWMQCRLKAVYPSRFCWMHQRQANCVEEATRRNREMGYV